MSKPDERLDRDDQRLKSALAELSPSPWLEDSVVDIAREEPWVDERAPTGWHPLVVISVAASVLAVIGFWLLLAAPDVQVDPVGIALAPDAGAASVFTPVSAQQTADARRASSLPFFGDVPASGNVWNSIGTTGEGAMVGYSGGAPGPLPFESRLFHRYLVNAREREPYDGVQLEYFSMAERGVMLAGQGLLEALGDVTVAGAGEQMVVFVGDKQWRPEPGTGELELFVGSPDEDGSLARVRIVLSTAYSGSLLLEEPIARALGLYQFEIPGGFVLKGPREIRGQQARARIRVPALDVDTLMHVQVRDPEPWNVVETKRDPDDKASAWVRLRGATPDGIGHADAVSLNEDGGLSVMQAPNRQDAMTMGVAGMARDGRVEVGLFREGPTQLCFQYDASDERPEALLFLGSIDVMPKERWTYTYDVEWVTLAFDDEPGARVIVARTWRGTTAMPSKEGVAVTHVGADGRIRFPRVVGEAGGTLRLLIERANSRSFHDVVLDGSADDRIVVEVRPEGVTLGASTYDVSAGSRERLRFQAELARIAEQRGGREPDGASTLSIEIRATPESRFSTLKAVLLTCASLDVRIYRVSYSVLGTPDRAIENPLPKDRGLGLDHDTPKPREITVAIRFVNERIHLLVSQTETTDAVDVRLDPDPVAAAARLVRAIRTARASDSVVGVISVVGTGDAVPYRAVHTILNAFHDAGVREVTFLASALTGSPLNPK